MSKLLFRKCFKNRESIAYFHSSTYVFFIYIKKNIKNFFQVLHGDAVLDELLVSFWIESRPCPNLHLHRGLSGLWHILCTSQDLCGIIKWPGLHHFEWGCHYTPSCTASESKICCISGIAAFSPLPWLDNLYYVCEMVRASNYLHGWNVFILILEVRIAVITYQTGLVLSHFCAPLFAYVAHPSL